MPNTIHYMRKERAWQKKFNATAPRVSDLAPNFELHDISGENQVQLSNFRGKKPVALVFGSFT